MVDGRANHEMPNGGFRVRPREPQRDIDILLHVTVIFDRGSGPAIVLRFAINGPAHLGGDARAIIYCHQIIIADNGID